MDLAFPGWSPSPRELSLRKGRRLILHLAPLTAQNVEEDAVNPSPAITSLSSLVSSSVDTVPITQAGGTPTTPNTPTTNAVYTPVRAALDQSEQQESPCKGSPSPSALERSLSSDGRWQRCSTQSTVCSLGDDEVRRVKALHKRYMDSIDSPRCLLLFLQDLSASDNLTECEQMLRKLETFLGTTRDQLVGSQIGVKTNEDKEVSKHLRVLSMEEAVFFATWIKSLQFKSPVSRSLKCASILVPSEKVPSEALEESSRSKLYDDGRGSRSPSSHRGPNNKDAYAGNATKTSLPSMDRSSRSSRSNGRLGSGSIPVSARCGALEKKAFAELGGGEDASGTIRIVDLKRMLRTFHFDVDFELCADHDINVGRTGRINFNEFLWLLECGVRGEGMAATIHDFLASPIDGDKNNAPLSPGRMSSRPQTNESGSPRSRLTPRLELPSVSRTPSRRQNNSVDAGLRRLSIKSETMRRKMTEELKQSPSGNVLFMSPYASALESRLSVVSTTRPKKFCSRKKDSVRPASRLPLSPRLPSPRAKNARTPFARKTSSAKRRRSSHRVTTQELQRLHDKQLRLTKRLGSLTGLPVNSHNAQKRQDQLQYVQEELNSVLQQIVVALGDIAVDQPKSGS